MKPFRPSSSGKRPFLLLCLALLVAAFPLRAEITPASLRASAQYSAEHRGQALLIAQHGQVITEEYPGGRAAEAHKIYSGTKGFWMLAALAAVEDGILQLDERAADTLPEWRGDSGKSRITLRQLLEFSSGLDAENRLHREAVPSRAEIALRARQVAPAGRAFIYGPAALQVFQEVFKRKLAPRGETPTQYLERKVLRPLGLGRQRYLADGRGDPLLATGFELTARQWAKMGALILRGGAPVIGTAQLAQCFRGSSVNRAFSLGYWNNRAASSPFAREFDIEDMLERKWPRQDWRSATICRDAPADLVASIGSGYQRLFVIPSLDLVIVRQGAGGRFSDAEFLRLLLGS